MQEPPSTLETAAGKEAAYVIEQLGGTAKVAKFFGIKQGSVSEWKTTGLPQARRRHLVDIRPDLFAGTDLAEQPTT